jgi:hypothetical protein
MNATGAADSSRVPVEFRHVWVLQKAKDSLEAAAEFSDYAEGYLLPSAGFLDALARAYCENGYSVDEFIDRDDLITTAEILVPEGIPPSWLLGYRLHGHWRQWRAPESGEVAARLDELVARWTAGKE